MVVLEDTNTTGFLRRVLWYLFLQLLVILCHVISIIDADLADNLFEGPILSSSRVPLAAPAIPDLPLPDNLPLLYKPWKKHFSPHGAPTFVIAPAQPPNCGPLITSGHPSMKKNALVPPSVGLVEVGPTQPPLSPIISDCCKLDMVLKPGSHGCRCVYPIKLELLLLSV